jgi:4-carboxymuconolactone decarboxylase
VSATPRIPPLTAWDEQQWELLSKTLLDERGRPLNVFATLAHHPRLLRRFNALGGLFLAQGELPARERELVILRVAARTGSEYEFGQHTGIGRRAGLSDEEIAAVVTENDWSERDAVLLAFTDELLAGDVVSRPTWDAVARLHGFGDAQMIELTLLVGFYRMLAGFLNTVGVALEDGAVG